MVNQIFSNQTIVEKVKNIRFLLTDCDGVLTDGGVYYSNNGEVMKRFNIRDGMGVERLRKVLQIEVGIISGEESNSIRKRAEKLGITELHLGIVDKRAVLQEIIDRRQLSFQQIAYMGDDKNDIEVMKLVGLTGCPRDAFSEIINQVDFISEKNGGHGAFRDFVEFIISKQAK